MENLVIIINPKSGKKQFLTQRNYLFKSLDDAGIQFEYRLTEFQGHATDIAKSFAENNYTTFLVLGGDGTISEAINGIFKANISNTNKIKLGLIPIGTGNDWGRFWGLNRNYKRSVEIFLKGKVQLIDIGKIGYNIEGRIELNYFINSIGFGLDSYVADITHRLKAYLGSHPFLYTIALLSSVFYYKSQTINVFSKEQNITENMFTMNIANGCYSGGGMKQNPNALPYDGLFDVMLAKRPTFLDIIGALRLLFKGKLLEHPVIESFHTQKITINSDKINNFETDGITIHGKGPFEIELLANSIQMIVP